jgi:hypothetical protein
MPDSAISIGIGIFLTAFVAGMLVGVGFEIGITPDEASISLFVAETFCSAVQEVDNVTNYHCGGLIFILIVISIVSLIASIAVESAKIGDWKVGLLIYAVGWLVGFFFILANL